MQVFDFDGTIYDGDSMVDFYCFALRRCPACAKILAHHLAAVALYATKRITLDQFKERIYSFLRFVPNTDALVCDFWKRAQGKLKPNVVACIGEGDVIASASPEFLLQPIAKQLGCSLIASQVDACTGKLLGPNCRGEEKARRLRQAGLGEDIEVFYTDSHVDDPCVAMAKRGVLVRGANMCDYS